MNYTAAIVESLRKQYEAAPAGTMAHFASSQANSFLANLSKQNAGKLAPKIGVDCDFDDSDDDNVFSKK